MFEDSQNRSFDFINQSINQSITMAAGDDAVDEEKVILCCALCCVNCGYYNACDSLGCSGKVR
jgi:hypothetical protein